MKSRLLVSAILAALVLPGAASAAGAPVFGLRPVGKPKLGYFVYQLAGGATTQGAVLVTNTGTAPGTVRIHAADASTGRTTGAIYLTDTKPTHAGAWVHIATPELTLAPHTYKRVAFTVQVPPGQQAGQWVGGIVAESIAATTSTKKRTPGKSGVQIRVRNQTIIAVQVDVPGTIAPNFEIGGATTGGQGGFQDLILHISNTGNGLTKPTGTATVLKNGTPVATFAFKMDTFLPQTAIDYPLLLKKALGPGTYETKVSLTYPGAGGASSTIHASPQLVVSKSDVAKVFTSAAPTKQPPGGAVASSGSSTPWALIAGIAAAVVVLLLLVLLLARRRKRPAPDPTVPPERVAAAAAPKPSPSPAPAPAPAPAPQPVEPAPIPDEPALAPPPAAAPPAPPPAAPVVPAAAAACNPYHFWDVAYERGELGEDAVWRFPHRCRTCGLELLATDIADASAQADALTR